MKNNQTAKDLLRSRNGHSKRMRRTSGRVRDEEDLLKRKKNTDRDWPQPFDKYCIIKKWLRTQVGRPWNTVYKDFCKKFPRKTAAGFFAHRALEWMVYRSITIANGNICRYRFGVCLPLSAGDLYVDFDSILKKVKRNAVVRQSNS